MLLYMPVFIGKIQAVRPVNMIMYSHKKAWVREGKKKRTKRMTANSVD